MSSSSKTRENAEKVRKFSDPYSRRASFKRNQRAKKYVCKALSFGIDTGYLVPSDSDGQVLRVSSALRNFIEQKEAGSEGERGMRQKLRRGSRTCTSEERKLLRRRGDLSAQKRTRSPSSAPSSASSAQRSPNKSRTKKPKYGRRIRKHKSRSDRKRKPKKRGRPRTRFSSAKIEAETTCACVDSEKQEEIERVGRDLEEGPSTPSGSEKDTSKSIKNEKLSDPSIDESNSSEKMSGAREK